MGVAELVMIGIDHPFSLRPVTQHQNQESKAAVVDRFQKDTAFSERYSDCPIAFCSPAAERPV